jgi:hypothetical protein
MLILCLGVTRANTATLATLSSNCLALIWSICLPVRQPVDPPLILSPKSRAMESAVCSASPVIMTTWMPAIWSDSIASATPRRGGSSIPWKPAKTRSPEGVDEREEVVEEGASDSADPKPYAMATTLSPLLATVEALERMAERTVESRVGVDESER